MGIIDVLKGLVNPKIEKVERTVVKIPLTKENAPLILDVLQRDLARRSAYAKIASEKLSEFKEKRLKTVKVNIPEKLQKALTDRKRKIFNEGYKFVLTTEPVKVADVNDYYLGRYLCNIIHHRLHYICFINGTPKIEIWGGGSFDQLFKNPESLKEQITKFRVIRLNFDKEGRYAGEDIIFS